MKVYGHRRRYFQFVGDSLWALRVTPGGRSHSHHPQKSTPHSSAQHSKASVTHTLLWQWSPGPPGQSQPLKTAHKARQSHQVPPPLQPYTLRAFYQTGSSPRSSSLGSHTLHTAGLKPLVLPAPALPARSFLTTGHCTSPAPGGLCV